MSKNRSMTLKLAPKNYPHLTRFGTGLPRAPFVSCVSVAQQWPTTLCSFSVHLLTKSVVFLCFSSGICLQLCAQADGFLPGVCLHWFHSHSPGSG